MNYIATKKFKISATVTLFLYEDEPDLGCFTFRRACQLNTGDIIALDEYENVLPVYGKGNMYHISKEDFEKHIKNGDFLLYTGYEKILSPLLIEKNFLEKQIKEFREQYIQKLIDTGNKINIITQSLSEYSNVSCTLTDETNCCN